MVLRRVRSERLNEMASLVNKLWDQHVPLSVRYAAAEAADAIVADWYESRAAFVADWDQRHAARRDAQ